MRLQTIGKAVLIVGFLGFLLGLSGCGSGGGGTGTTLHGKLLDDGTLTGIAGATVVAPGGQGITANADGSFTLGNLAQMPDSLTATAPGYQTLSVTVTEEAKKKGTVGALYLKPARVAGTGNISGIVTQAGLPAVGTSVRAGGKLAVTKADGTYTVHNVPMGSQAVAATSANGSAGATSSVTVISQTTVTVNLALSTQPPLPPAL